MVYETRLLHSLRIAKSCPRRVPDLPPHVYSFVTMESGFETSYLLSRQTGSGRRERDPQIAPPPPSLKSC